MKWGSLQSKLILLVIFIAYEEYAANTDARASKESQNVELGTNCFATTTTTTRKTKISIKTLAWKKNIW